MSVPPLPLLLFAIALLGWPSLKLAATLVARPIWREQRVLLDRLLAESDLEPRFKKLAEDTYFEGRGSALQLVLPVVVFFGGIAVAFEGSEAEHLDFTDLDERLLVEREPELKDRAKLFFRDEHYRQMIDHAFVLAALRYPVCSILTLVAFAPAAGLIAVMTGFRASQRRLLAATVAASRNAVRVFELSFGGRTSRA